MTGIFIGQRYTRRDTPGTIWVVDAVIDKDGKPDQVLLMTEDGLNVHEVDVAHLEDETLYRLRH